MQRLEAVVKVQRNLLEHRQSMGGEQWTIQQAGKRACRKAGGVIREQRRWDSGSRKPERRSAGDSAYEGRNRGNHK